METYQEWLKEHQRPGGGYDRLVKVFLDNPELMQQMTFFEIKKEK